MRILIFYQIYHHLQLILYIFIHFIQRIYNLLLMLFKIHFLTIFKDLFDIIQILLYFNLTLKLI